jgi:hypothetical protein
VYQTVRLNTPEKQDVGFELVVPENYTERRCVLQRLAFEFDRDDGSDGGNSENNDGWSGGGRDGDGHGDGYDGGTGRDEGGLLGDLLRRGSAEMTYSSSPILLSPYPPVASTPDDGRTSQASMFVLQAVLIFPGEIVLMGIPEGQVFLCQRFRDDHQRLIGKSMVSRSCVPLSVWQNVNR